MTDILKLKTKGRKTVVTNDEGFILVITMFILVVLSIIGLSATSTTQLELKIAGNDRIHKETFYQADAGTELGIRLTYENAVCVQTDGEFKDTGGDEFKYNDIIVKDRTFSTPGITVPWDIEFYPAGLVAAPSIKTNIKANGTVKFSPGSGLQMISGYEGLGASSAAGGTHLEFDIISQHQGVQNSQSQITVGWKLSTHIINNASSSDCNSIYR